MQFHEARHIIFVSTSNLTLRCEAIASCDLLYPVYNCPLQSSGLSTPPHHFVPMEIVGWPAHNFGCMQSDTVANGKSKGFTTHKARFEGGEPSEDWMEWCQSTAKSPSVVSFQTRSVASLVITGLERRLDLLTAMAAHYCVGCFVGGTE